MNRRILLTLIASICLVPSLRAQVVEGWPQRQDREHIFVDPEGKNITIDRNTYAWRPFDSVVGYSIYGSRYRKAKASYNWGIFLSCVAAPVAGIGIAYAMDGWTIAPAWCVAGGLAVGGGILGAGIPLWVKGRKELDWMLDDYARRYGPKPHSARLSAGPTRSGIGLALNF